MATYTTKQRKVLLDFLSEHPHEIFSAAQIAEELNSRGISTSSVYRNLSELETMGTIRKVTKSGTREAYYQYINAKDCQGQIHIFCKGCEKAYHMKEEKAKILSEYLLEEEGFILDKNSTVIYGTCKDCKG